MQTEYAGGAIDDLLDEAGSDTVQISILGTAKVSQLRHPLLCIVSKSRNERWMSLTSIDIHPRSRFVSICHGRRFQELWEGCRVGHPRGDHVRLWRRLGRRPAVEVPSHPHHPLFQ